MKWYIAGPLFNDMEKTRNKEIASLIESFGFSVYLPQRDGGVFSDMVASGKNIPEVRDEIFNNDSNAIKACDGIICLLDGRVPDEGMCIELGMSYALGKKCIGYKTDSRVSESEGMNIILEGSLEKIFTTKNELEIFFSSLK